MKQENHVTEPCASFQDDLKAYCDGELSWLRRIRIRRHLAACVPCREEAHAMQRLHQELRDGESSDATFAPALRARILAQVATVPPLPAPRRTPRLWQYGFAASVAANCLLLFLWWYRTGTLPSPQPVSSAARPGGASAPMVPVTPSKPKRPLPSVEAARNGGADTTMAQDTSHPPAGTAPSQNPVAHSVASIRPSPPETAKAKSLAARVTPAAKTIRAYRQVSLPGPSAVITTPGTDALRAAARQSDGETRPQPAPALKPDVSDASVPGGALEPQASPPLAAGTADKTVSPPTSPPAPAPIAPVAASPPAAFARSLGGGGFGASAPARMKVGAERDKPIALNPWPTLSGSANPDAGSRALKIIKADWQIDEQGRISDIHFAAPGSVALVATVQDAIRRNRYLPAQKHGKPVAARMSHEFVINP